MNMANIITLSSSPPTTFARSPTPITFSSSPRAISDSHKDNRHAAPDDFKPAQALRKGFSPGFTTARHVLGAKPNAENVPVVPLKSFRANPSFPPTDSFKASNPAPTMRHSPIPGDRRHQLATAVKAFHNETVQHTVVKILPSDVRRNKKVRNVGPVDSEKAIARRNDWTPPKPTTSSSVTNTSGFGVDLRQSFGNKDYTLDTASAHSAADTVSHKRRKIDPTSAGNATPAPGLMPLTKNNKSATKTRNRSPAKKALTITSLTTSHYLEDDQQQDNPSLMMQFLVSTQARMQSDNSSETIETKLPKKSINSKAKKSRSRLRSPRTSMKTIEEQDVVFASASQLARDESPTLLRDTIEAIKQSEEESFTDQVLTQQTAPISIESTSPKSGIARFRGRKNLWSAAHRDENDALLYQNDPFDESNTREALAGKNVLVQDDSVTEVNDAADDSLALLAALNKEATITYDIDDLTTPPQTMSKTNLPVEMKRSYSTSSRHYSKRMKDASAPPEVKQSEPQLQDEEVDTQKPKIPPKPNYAIWTDEQLKEKVNEYGFKRLRARKTMIDKLDEHWAQQYGLNIAAVKAATKAASKTVVDRDHGSFLSSVHELAPRPVPKAKKSRTKKSDGELFTGVTKRKSKSKLVETSKNTEPADDSIFDIDELDDTTALERLAAIVPFSDEPIDALEPSTAPVKGTGVKAVSKPKAKRKTKSIEQPLTPPPTMPEDPIQDSSPGFESPRRGRISAILDESLKSHIQAALLNTSKTDKRRNYQTNPTWHEKILLYDPIVLEDFTAWLNTEGFNEVGIDEEIDAKDVKVWCEENGVCCLWKGGWRGNKVKE